MPQMNSDCLALVSYAGATQPLMIRHVPPETRQVLQGSNLTDVFSGPESFTCLHWHIVQIVVELLLDHRSAKEPYLVNAMLSKRHLHPIIQRRYTTSRATCTYPTQN